MGLYIHKLQTRARKVGAKNKFKRTVGDKNSIVLKWPAKINTHSDLMVI